MTGGPSRHHRRSIRLQGYDYSRPGAYFVTICVQNRECLFGEIVNGQMRLNGIGKIASDSWELLGEQYDHVSLDEWVIMPNHMHGIIIITDGNADPPLCRGGSRTAPTVFPSRKPIGRLIGAFKTVSTKRVNESRKTPGAQLWQRNYYEYVVRNNDELNNIRQYIMDNPIKWDTDRENPEAVQLVAKIKKNFEELGI